MVYYKIKTTNFTSWNKNWTSYVMTIESFNNMDQVEQIKKLSLLIEIFWNNTALFLAYNYFDVLIINCKFMLF